MTTVLSSLSAVFIMIALGWALERSKLFPPAMWEGLEKLCYLVLFPLLIAETLAKANLAAVPIWGTAGTMALAVLMMAGLLVLARALILQDNKVDGPSFSSLFQGATRWNTFVCLAIVGDIYGDRGLSITAVGMAAMIPLLNIVNVAALATYASPQRPSVSSIGLQMLKNPFIWSCILGLLWNMTGIKLVGPLNTVVDSLGKAALSIGLLVVGAGLELRALKKPHVATLIALPVKLLLMPLLMVIMGWTLGLDKTALAILAVCGGVQTASNSYVLAKQMGGNANVMTEIITLQTLGSALTLPLWLWLLT